MNGWPIIKSTQKVKPTMAMMLLEAGLLVSLQLIIQADSTTANWTRRQVTSFSNISDQIDANATKINLHKNLIECLMDFEFSKFKFLATLSISKNQIKHVSNSSFVNTTITDLDLRKNLIDQFPVLESIANTLKKLNLNNNKIMNIPCRLLQSLTSLKKLHMEGNELKAIPTVCEGTFSIDTLTLSKNKITALPIHVLDMYNELLFLTLNQNYITTVPQLMLLVNMSHPLKAIYLNENQISNISDQAFVPLKNLVYVGMYSNAMYDFPNINNSARLEQLNVGDNYITEIPAYIQTGLQELQYLRVSENSDMGCMPELTASINSMTKLYLSNTKVSQCSTDYLTNFTALEIVHMIRTGATVFPNLNKSADTLKELHVNYNPFTDVPSTVLSGFTALEILQISGIKLEHWLKIEDAPLKRLSFRGNQLSHFPDFKGKLLETLTHLYLSNNLLEIVSSKDVSKLKKMQVLDISKNRIQHITDLTVLSNLTDVSIMDNPFWCDCNAAWMKTGTLTFSLEASQFMCNKPTNLSSLPWEEISFDMLARQKNQVNASFETSKHCFVNTTSSTPEIVLNNTADFAELNGTTSLNVSITNGPEVATTPLLNTTALEVLESNYQTMTTAPDDQTSAPDSLEPTKRLSKSGFLLKLFVAQSPHTQLLANLSAIKAYYETPVEAPGAVFFGLAAIIFISVEFLLIVLTDLPHFHAGFTKFKQILDI